MSLSSKVDFYYKLALIRLAQVIDKTKVGPTNIDSFSDRIVMSDKEKFDLTSKRVPQTAATRKNKPHGVWYAFGTSWIHLMEIRGEHAYRINIDDSKILKLNPSNMEAFIEKYTTFIEGEDVARSMGVDVENLPPSKRRELQYFFTDKKAIDWEKVASTYAGVEIRDMQNFPVDMRHSWDFIGAWDIDSGCVWDTSIIKGAVPLGQAPEFPGEYDEQRDYFGGYWGESSEDIGRMFEGKSGKMLGSELSPFDLRFLSARLPQYQVNLTYEQLAETEFLVAPTSITLVKVPAAPSFEGKVINFEPYKAPPPFAHNQ